jgi:hypothetical protein
VRLRKHELQSLAARVQFSNEPAFAISLDPATVTLNVDLPHEVPQKLSLPPA